MGTLNSHFAGLRITPSGTKPPFSAIRFASANRDITAVRLSFVLNYALLRAGHLIYPTKKNVCQVSNNGV